MRAISHRLSRIEWELFLPQDGLEPQLIRVSGGLPDDDGLHASVGDLLVFAEPGETPAAFESRCLDVAAEVGVPYVVVGGLRPMSE